MRALLPEFADEPDLHEFYGVGWEGAGGLRANMVASVDGAATSAGLSRGLQTPGDNRVFGVLRDLADVVLVGAATAVAENYRPMRSRTLALASRSLRIDPTVPFLTDASARPIVYTCQSANADARAALAKVADVVITGEQEVDLSVAKADLAARGLTRILTEGGPTLLAAIAGAGVLDELCLSITPLLAGPGSIRIVDGPSWPTHRQGLVLTGLLEEDGALFARYRTSAG